MSRCSLVWRRRRTGTVWSPTWSSLPPLNLLLVYDFWRWFLSFWYWLLSAPGITWDDWVRIISYCNSPCLDRLLSLSMGRCSCLTFDSLSKICSTTAFCAHLTTKLKFSSLWSLESIFTCLHLIKPFLSCVKLATWPKKNLSVVTQ